MNELMKIYKSLLDEYGEQGWWPVTKKGEIHPQYTGGPKTEKQILEVMFGAILTQNTSWKNVEKAIACLNQRDLIDSDRILELEHEELVQVIRSSGYHNQKARSLKNLCQFLKTYSIFGLKKMTIEDARELLLSVKGIGPETADSILLYALKKPLFVIDAYTKRIFGRIGICDKSISYHDLQTQIMDSLDENNQMFNEYHALLVEHAKQYCRTKPLCDLCFLRKKCKQIL